MIKLDHHEDNIEFTEYTEVAHRTFLDNFKELVWPIFRNKGYTKGEALNYWMQCKIIGEIQGLREALSPETYD